MDVVTAVSYLRNRYSFFSGYFAALKVNPSFQHPEMLSHTELLTGLIEDLKRATDFIEKELADGRAKKD